MAEIRQHAVNDFFGIPGGDKSIIQLHYEPWFLLNYYVTALPFETHFKDLPVALRKYALDRIQEEFDKASKKENAGFTGKAAHMNTEDLRGLMGMQQTRVPAHLRKPT